MMSGICSDWVETGTRFVSFSAAILLGAVFAFHLFMSPIGASGQCRFLVLPNRFILVLLGTGYSPNLLGSLSCSVQ
jgi:hypothetical protein